MKTGELLASSIYIVNNYVYFPSFKWLRSKFEKKVPRRRNKLRVANSGTLTNSQDENPLIVVEYIINITGHLLLHSHIPWTTVFPHLFSPEAPSTDENCGLVVIEQPFTHKKNIIAKCNEKSIKHNCDIENEVK